MRQPTTTMEHSPLLTERLVSLDALRGFDMLWIIGGVPILQAAADLTGWNWLVQFRAQMNHTAWNGFTLYDLIFPLFLFIAGVAMPFSFEKRLAQGETKSELAQHVIVRGLVLVLFGMIFNGLLQFDSANVRVPSVLGRIGLAYLFAGLIVLNTGVAGRVAATVAVLLGYWAAMKWIPVPGHGSGDLAPGHNLADFIDQHVLPGKLLPPGEREPEGILSTIPAIGTALLGALTGQFLKNARYSGYAKSLALFVAGLPAIGLSLLWHPNFPINKTLWSSSFVLLCAGCSLVLLSMFYLVIDVWRLRAWAFFFVVIGSNSILIYMAQKFIDFDFTTKALFGGALKHTGPYNVLLSAIAIVAVKWLMLYFLYRKRI